MEDETRLLQCGLCKFPKGISEYSAPQWEKGTDRMCEACLHGKLCGRCQYPRALSEYSEAELRKGRSRICESCKQREQEERRNSLKSIQHDESLRSITSEGTSSRTIRSSLTRASIVSKHGSSKFVEQRFEHIRQLGRGGMGTVNLVRDKDTHQEFVCKVVNIESMDESLLDSTKQEIEYLCALDHPGVVKIYEYSIDENNEEIVMVLEVLRGGDGFDLMEQQVDGKSLKEALVADIIRQLLTALNYCHNNGVIHRDVKPENIMLTSSIDLDAEKADCKLIDFGVSATKQARELQGTPPYTAPEVAIFSKKEFAVHVKSYSSKADIWSVGVTAFELLFDVRPFPVEKNSYKTLEHILAYEQFSDLNEILQKNPLYRQRSPQALDFLESLLVKDQEERPTALEALKHPWLAKEPQSLGTPQCQSLSRGFSWPVGGNDSMGYTHSGSQPNFMPKYNTVDTLQNMIGYEDEPRVIRCCLFVIAARLGASELERIGKTFLKIDQNRSGLIKREEFKSAIAECDQFSDKDGILAAFNAADLDHSGDISFTEFVALCLYSRHQQERERSDYDPDALLKKAFLALDVDRDRKVGAEELRSLFEADCGLCENLDSWNGKRIGLDEFIELIRTHEAKPRCMELPKECFSH